jgi:hypothetical protein
VIQMPLFAFADGGSVDKCGRRDEDASGSAYAFEASTNLTGDPLLFVQRRVKRQLGARVTSKGEGTLRCGKPLERVDQAMSSTRWRHPPNDPVA